MELTEQEKQIAKTWNDDQLNEYNKLRSTGSNQLSAFYSANNLNKVPEAEVQEEMTFAQKARSKAGLPNQDVSNLQQFAQGVFKSSANTILGTGEIGQSFLENTVGRAIRPVSNAFRSALGKDQLTEEQVQGVIESPLFTRGTDTNLAVRDVLTPRGAAEEAGSFITDVAQFAIPSSRLSTLMSNANRVRKLGANAITSAGIATLQEGEVGQDTAIAGATEAAMPALGVVTKVGSKVVGKLLQGLGSAFSGASSEVIEQIAKNPQTARQVRSAIQNEGAEAILRKNAESIVNGVSKVRQDARGVFGNALDQLEQVPIKPEELRTAGRQFAEKNGITLGNNGKMNLNNLEFNEPKNLTKAENLLKEVNNFKDFTGKGVRSLMNKIDDAQFKTATTDERISFNLFLRDLSETFRDVITKNSDVLQNANREYSEAMGLTEAVESIFGKVKFKNEKEILKASERLDSLFTQKGLRPETVNKFLVEIGEQPQVFRTGEAVRQIGEITPQTNAPGASIYELIRTVTGSVVTPKIVRDLTIATGLTTQALESALNSMSPVARAAFINALTDISGEE